MFGQTQRIKRIRSCGRCAKLYMLWVVNPNVPLVEIVRSCLKPKTPSGALEVLSWIDRTDRLTIFPSATCGRLLAPPKPDMIGRC